VLAVLLASGLGATVMTSSSGGAGAATPRASATPAQLAYTALTPSRIADTRCGATPAPSFCASESLPAANASLTTVAGGGSITVAMPSSVPSTAEAVVLNVAAVDQSGSGFLTVWPTSGVQPTTANLTFAPSQSSFGVSNLVTVALGTSGSTPAVSIFDGPDNGGSVDVTVDLQGYYAPQIGNAGGFTSESPTRIADSRCTGTSAPSFCASESLPSANSGVITLGPGATDTLTVAGVGGVPETGVAAAIMNVAVTNTTAPSFLSVYPGTTRLQVANLNWTTGETLSNKVLVDLGPTGQVTLYNNGGSADVVIDVDGWFSSALALTDGSLLTPLSPVRLADTRCGATPVPSFCASEALPPANAALSSLGGGQSAAVTIGGQDGVPSAATAAVLNVTDVQPEGGNYLTVYPAGSAAPVAADVTYVPADPYDVVPNAAYADLGTGGVASVLNGPSGAGSTNVVVDLFGYFSPAGTGTSSLVANVTSLVPGESGTSMLTSTLSGLSTVSDLPVSLSEVPSLPGACGTLMPASGVTDAAGQFVSTYTASDTVGVCQVTATVDGLTSSPVSVIQALPVGSGTVGLLPSVTSVLANGTSTSTLTSSLLSGGVPIAGVPVSFNEIPSLPGSCGTLSPASGVTDAAGQLVSTYTASTAIGTCTITSTMNGLVTSAVLLTQL
jgi:hypothetical protein